ncbi:transposase-related [Holotrichia oblita]|uniref:Transposase-related n=1 Tax=Holotrichia oblita TaxID=644536 RepID=A0ACB9TY23_HOLOL|nr:transposase-related [Holotrichia oblita]
MMTSTSLRLDIFGNENYLLPNNFSDNNLLIPTLSEHIRCASHTVALITTTDIMKIINSTSSLRSKHEQAMARCNHIWKKAGRPKSAELIKKVLGHTLSYPDVTRWNSMFAALNQILNSKEKLDCLYEKLKFAKQDRLSDTDLNYLAELCQILKPFALALDILQGEQNMFGYLLPSIVSLFVKIEKLKTNKFKYVEPILIAFTESLNSRFEKLLKLTNQSAIIATVINPLFKTHWLTAFREMRNIENDSRIKDLIIIEAIKIIKENEEQFNVNNNNITQMKSNKLQTTSLNFMLMPIFKRKRKTLALAIPIYKC